MRNNYEIKFKFKVKTKYLRKFINSLGALFFAVSGCVLFAFFMIIPGYFLLDLFGIFDEYTMYASEERNYWLLLWGIPVIAVYMTFEIGDKFFGGISWCWDTAGELANKKYKD